MRLKLTVDLFNSSSRDIIAYDDYGNTWIKENDSDAEYWYCEDIAKSISIHLVEVVFNKENLC